MESTLLAWLLLLLFAGCECADAGIDGFQLIQGSLCILSQHTVEVATSLARTTPACAYYCSTLDNCQAFEPPEDGPCRLFVFDKCSRPLENCGACNRTGKVFVRRRPGLSPGRLCPDTYGNSRCGLSYRLAFGSHSWMAFKTLAAAEPGVLAGFADALTASEMAWVRVLSARFASSFFLSGAQLPGSSEPAEGFYWSRCNQTVDMSFFWPGDPNNLPPGEDFIGVYFGGGTEVKGLVDVPADPYNTALFMCVSPFD